MLKSTITEQSPEHYVDSFPIPGRQPIPQTHEPSLEYVLFEEFPQLERQPDENIPDIVSKELLADADHVSKEILVTSRSRRKRVTLAQSRLSEMDERIESIQVYLSNIANWAPGYNSGIDGIRSSLLSAKSRLEQERHLEQLKCLDDCSRMQQSLLDMFREYERLKADIGLLAD
ncbi:MAG: hypothetical protein ABIH23_14360 [bacterium]